jgi:hypothetical protein
MPRDSRKVRKRWASSGTVNVAMVVMTYWFSRWDYPVKAVGGDETGAGVLLD